MDDLGHLHELLRTHRPAEWAQLPDFALYMDQVLAYMDRQVLRYEDDDGLTSAMVNNYTKGGLVPRAAGKKYSREHMAYLTVICILKRVMSARDMGTTIRAELESLPSIEEGYQRFLETLDESLNFIADEASAYPMGENDADAAVHFALLSYAAGLVSSYYVARLRENDPQPDKKKKAPKTKKENV